MRNSIALWLLSGLVSVGAHAGTLAALSQISLPRIEEQRPTELLVTTTAFDDLFQTEVDQTASAPVVSTTEGEEIAAAKETPFEDLEPKAADDVSALEGGGVEAAPSSPVTATESALAPPVKNPAETAAVTDQKEEAPAQSAQLAPASAASELDAAKTADGADTAAVSSAASAAVPSAASVAVPPAASAEVTDHAAVGAQSSPDAGHQASSEQTPAASGGVEITSGEGSLLAAQSGTAFIAQQPAPAGTGAPVASPEQSQQVQEGTAVAAVAGGTTAPAPATPAPELGALSGGTVAAVAAPSSAPVNAKQTESLAALDDAAPIAPAAQPQKTANVTRIAGPALSQAERIRAFLKTKGDRPCIYAKPGNLNAGRPTFTGYGGGGEMISEFAAEFQKSVGVDPRLAMRSVMQAQCPAVDFIRTLRAVTPKEIAVIIDNQAIADYGNLIGHLEGDLGEHVLLLLVDDDGAVQDISSELARKGDKNVFAQRAILRGAGSKSRYQMLLALSSSKPFDITAEHMAGEAAKVFDALTVQARDGQRDLALGIASFRID